MKTLAELPEDAAGKVIAWSHDRGLTDYPLMRLCLGWLTEEGYWFDLRENPSDLEAYTAFEDAVYAARYGTERS